VLQLRDLEGNIVGAVEDNHTVTKLASTYNSTEFGVPTEGKTPPKYAWLGAAGPEGFKKRSGTHDAYDLTRRGLASLGPSIVVPDEAHVAATATLSGANAG
jgi:hypothetical protein